MKERSCGWGKSRHLCLPLVWMIPLLFSTEISSHSSHSLLYIIPNQLICLCVLEPAFRFSWSCSSSKAFHFPIGKIKISSWLSFLETRAVRVTHLCIPQGWLQRVRQKKRRCLALSCLLPIKCLSWPWLGSDSIISPALSQPSAPAPKSSTNATALSGNRWLLNVKAALSIKLSPTSSGGGSMRSSTRYREEPVITQPTQRLVSVDGPMNSYTDVKPCSGWAGRASSRRQKVSGCSPYLPQDDVPPDRGGGQLFRDVELSLRGCRTMFAWLRGHDTAGHHCENWSGWCDCARCGRLPMGTEWRGNQGQTVRPYWPRYRLVSWSWQTARGAHENLSLLVLSRYNPSSAWRRYTLTISQSTSHAKKEGKRNISAATSSWPTILIFRF